MKRNQKPIKTAQQRLGLLLLTGCMLVVANLSIEAQPYVVAPLIEITEVKNLGVSATNDSKSILQVQWAISAQPTLSIKSFDVVLEVVYADSASERFKTAVSGSERKARFEVPTLHGSTGKANAELRSFKANITANFSETAIKQGNF